MLKKVFILIVLVIVGFSAYITIKNKQVGATPFAMPLNVRFVMLPSSQAEPRVYRYGAWKVLPTTDSTVVSFNYSNMAGCGKGGVYVYDLKNDELKYILKKDWYTCHAISFNSEDYVSVINSERKIIINPHSAKIVNEIELEKGDTSDLSQDKVVKDTTEVCDDDKTICANPDRRRRVYVTTDGETKEVDIRNAIALLGIRNNVLLYATGLHQGGVFTAMKNQFQISDDDNYLYGYDVNTKLKIRLLENFKYNDEQVVFF